MSRKICTFVLANAAAGRPNSPKAHVILPYTLCCVRLRLCLRHASSVSVRPCRPCRAGSGGHRGPGVVLHGGAHGASCRGCRGYRRICRGCRPLPSGLPAHVAQGQGGTWPSGLQHGRVLPPLWSGGPRGRRLPECGALRPDRYADPAAAGRHAPRTGQLPRRRSGLPALSGHASGRPRGSGGHRGGGCRTGNHQKGLALYGDV